MDNLNIVYKKAAQNAPVLGTLLQKVAQRTGAKPISNYKNPITALGKVEEKQEESPSRHYTIQDVNDIARGRLVYNSYDALKKGIESFKASAKQSGLKIAKEQNFFTKPEDGYRGYHVDVSFPNGQHSEVQFHTQQSYANTLATHKSHEMYGDKPPAPVSQENEKIGDQVMQLPNREAAKISQSVEAENAPQMQQAQQMAKAVIQNPSLESSSYQPIHSRGKAPEVRPTVDRGTPNASVASPLPLQSQPSSVGFNPGM